MFSKSTLLKLLRGELTPTSGELIRNRFVRIGNFDQHSGDQFDLELTPVDHLKVSLYSTYLRMCDLFIYFLNHRNITIWNIKSVVNV